MNCQERDSNLLLYGVGELNIWEKSKLSLHLLTCGRCRQRQAELAGVSLSLASELKSGYGESAVKVVRFNATSTLLLLSAMVVLLGTLIFTASILYARAHPAAIRQTDDGCSPGLPSDRCK